MSEPTAPFSTLGRHLKYVREQAQQSLDEVSGAVEIDAPLLERIEAGLVRPAEDVLLLMISHFEVQDQEAVQLWELAQYDSEELPDQIRPEAIQSGSKPVVMLLSMEVRTVYSDGLDISCNRAGVTLNFTQAGSQKPTSVSRVGMSYEQAEQVLANLQKALLQAKYLRGPKSLPQKTDHDKSL